MEESSIINIFFDKLALRMRNENDLSDVTWTMCQASPKFYEWFIHFFFKEIKDIKSIIEFTREYPDEQGKGCRVDFFIKVRNENSPYIIENKIGDLNQHFGDYDVAYRLCDKDHFGYIANYPLAEDGYNRIRQWSELYDQLSKDIESFTESEEKILIEAYLSYVKNVCNIIKLDKKMNLQNLYSMFELFQILKDLTTRQESDFIVSFYGNNQTQNGYNIKFWFEINYTNSTIPKDWGVIGLWYNEEHPILAVGFQNNEGWGRHIYELLEKQKFTDYQYCSKPYSDEGFYFIEIKSDVMKSIDEVITLEEQKTIIRNFMDEALRIPLANAI